MSSSHLGHTKEINVRKKWQTTKEQGPLYLNPQVGQHIGKGRSGMCDHTTLTAATYSKSIHRSQVSLATHHVTSLPQQAWKLERSTSDISCPEGEDKPVTAGYNTIIDMAVHLAYVSSGEGSFNVAAEL
jgi:hypothetical protein